jgi:hypothetical protein
VATSGKCSRFIGQAIRLPSTIEISTAVWLMNPLNSRVITTSSRMTAAARAMC